MCQRRLVRNFWEVLESSRGLKNGFQLRLVRVTGEAASSDEEGAHKFIDNLDEIITEEGYLVEQIFNVDETGLFWRQMPAGTYIHKEAKSMPEFNVFKNRLTLLLDVKSQRFISSE